MAVKKTGSNKSEEGSGGKKANVYQPPAGKVLVQLCNGVQTYVTPTGEVYVANKVYAVAPAKQEELFSYQDAIQGFPIFRTAVIKKRQVTEESYIAEAGKVSDSREIDTGAMKLHDAEGTSVGTVEV